MLQEKDNKLLVIQKGSGKSGMRQQSVERFVQRFSREVDNEDEIEEKHIILRRILLRKFKSVHDWLKRWQNHS